MLLNLLKKTLQNYKPDVLTILHRRFNMEINSNAPPKEILNVTCELQCDVAFCFQYTIQSS